MVLIAIMARLCFHSPLSSHLITAIVIVAASVALYNKGDQEQQELDRKQIGFQVDSCR